MCFMSLKNQTIEIVFSCFHTSECHAAKDRISLKQKYLLAIKEILAQNIHKSDHHHHISFIVLCPHLGLDLFGKSPS